MEMDLVESFVDLYRGKNRNGILDLMADEVVVSDPHFPVTTMIGKYNVKRGLNWSFSAISHSDINIISISANGPFVFVELDTTHYLKIGLKYQYVQVLKIEISNSKISSISTYVTYPPGGLRGLLRRGFALAWYLNDVAHNKLFKRTALRTAA